MVKVTALTPAPPLGNASLEIYTEEQISGFSGVVSPGCGTKTTECLQSLDLMYFWVFVIFAFLLLAVMWMLTPQRDRLLQSVRAVRFNTSRRTSRPIDNAGSHNRGQGMSPHPFASATCRTHDLTNKERCVEYMYVSPGRKLRRLDFLYLFA